MRMHWPTLFAVVAIGCAHSVDEKLVQAGLHQGLYALASEESDSLVVISYNIKFAEQVEQAIVDLRENPWSKDADVLLLQEMDDTGTERIASELGYDYVYYPASIHPRHDRPFGNAVLVRGSVESHRFIPLPSGGIFPVTSRIAVVARVRLRGRAFSLVSTHTSTVMVPPETRLEQSEAIRNELAGVKVPIVIGGDFNSMSRQDVNELRAQMYSVGLEHARLPHGATVRNRGAWKWVGDVEMVLDHFFYRGLELRRTGIDTKAMGSDHYPIWAVFEWPAPP